MNPKANIKNIWSTKIKIFFCKRLTVVLKIPNETKIILVLYQKYQRMAQISMEKAFRECGILLQRILLNKYHIWVNHTSLCVVVSSKLQRKIIIQNFSYFYNRPMYGKHFQTEDIKNLWVYKF